MYREEGGAVVKPTNQEWLKVLHRPGPDETLADLRTILVSGLRHALARRSGVNEAALLDFVEEALLKILAGPDSFGGERRFTTQAKQGPLSYAPTGW